MRLKLKPCKEDGKLVVLWSHGYCKYHWMLRTAKKQIEEKKKEGSKNDLLEKWYRFIFDKYKGICQETGRQLTFSKKFCLHLLPKRKGNMNDYSYFATNPNNGIVADWWVHDIVDHGSAKQRKELKIWGQISQRRKELLESVGMEYSEEFWLNMKT